jgi:hypothetical protein
MLFSEVVSKITTSRGPIDIELSLLNSVPYPVKTNVHDFGVLLFYSVVDNAKGSGVVCLYGGGGLRMIHFFKYSEEWNRFFDV